MLPKKKVMHKKRTRTDVAAAAADVDDDYDCDCDCDCEHACAHARCIAYVCRRSGNTVP